MSRCMTSVSRTIDNVLARIERLERMRKEVAGALTR